MDLEILLSLILIIGVLLSLIFLIAGLFMYLVSEGPRLDLGIEFRYLNLVSWIEAVPKMCMYQRLLSIGLIILILTPYIRAVTSFVWFMYHKDKKFSLFTLFVIIILTLSILGLIRVF
ncbi:MAG: DUF1634 domain-containing protein [Sulfolobales archaeon]